MSEVDVLSNGAVVLTPEVVCDGFVHNVPVRAQTHIHDDHMEDFDRSKGFQNLIMSEATRELLVADRNADLPFRSNVIGLTPEHAYQEGRSLVRLIPSDHMLGSCQVQVERDDGFRVGYSGDFQWPMRSPIKVDVLVVDSTYGSPDAVREETQAEIEARFLELVLSHVKQGSVHIKAHRGTIQRAVHLLGADVREPVLCSKRLYDEIGVYQKYGSAVCDLIHFDSPAGRDLIKSGRYIRIYSKGDGDPVENPKGVTITLSAFMTRGQAVLEFSERAFRVAISNHADFEGTLAYVAATGAKRVVTDNTRGQYGVILAQEISSRLGIPASPSRALTTHAWGQGAE